MVVETKNFNQSTSPYIAYEVFSQKWDLGHKISSAADLPHAPSASYLCLKFLFYFKQQASGDEYIPIEHVLGVNRKKIRLLNPYVLRLRRKPPFQAYKLQKVDVRIIKVLLSIFN